uniref:Bulb-type lectin domain-containing protein n=1 Tax=Fusarium oxysporum (strain Fo5176) TaxID=660025 RepID=A0A0D2YHD0_FUSOF
MCIDSAVEATDENVATLETVPPKITYSSKLFERVSEAVDTMDISRAVTIKSGRMEVHGHKDALNDAKIDDADISLMISVRVMSQITNVKGSARFFPIDGMEVGSPRFNETFGDSYISGFIRGGLFTSIISFICSNPEHKDKMMEAIKEASTDSTVNLDNICKVAAITSIIQGVKVEDVTAILTKYKGNRSFNEWSKYQTLKPLEYDGIASYTSKLFYNYMQYKKLSRKVQDIISHREKYTQVDKPRAIPLELNTLLAARSAIDKEINKIVAVVDNLTRHPELLPNIDCLNANPKDELVQDIVNEALSESSQPVLKEEFPAQDDLFLPSVADYSPSESSSGVEELHTPWTSDHDSDSLSGRSLVFREKVNTSTDLTMHALVPPEVWTDLLPVKNEPTTSLISPKTKTVSVFNVKYKKLQILAAVCGTHDVAVKLWDWVSPGETGDRLVIPIKAISTLENRDYRGGLKPKTTTNLSFIYKYTDRSIRICSFDHDEQSTETLVITHESESHNATFVHTSRSTCFILGVTYGGKIYSSSEDLRRFVDNADYGTPRDWPSIQFNRDTIKDEHLGKDGMTGVVFYTYSMLNGVQSAVSMGIAGFNGANDNLLKKDSKEFKPYQITLGKGIEAPGKSCGGPDLVQSITCPAGYSCTFQRGTLKVSPSETPFMQFENGVKFAFRNNGRLEVLDKQDEVFWSSEEAPEGQVPQRLEFCKDGRLRLWSTDEQVYWTPLMNFTRYERKMVFSSESPYLEIYNSEGEQLWRAHGLHLV